MFREYRGNTSVFPGSGLEESTTGQQENKRKRPVIRTLEPRMVFDAATAVAVHHAPPVAHPEPAHEPPHAVERAGPHFPAALETDPAAKVETPPPLQVAPPAAVGHPTAAGDHGKGIGATSDISKPVPGDAGSGNHGPASVVQDINQHIERSQSVRTAIIGAQDKLTTELNRLTEGPAGWGNWQAGEVHLPLATISDGDAGHTTDDPAHHGKGRDTEFAPHPERPSEVRAANADGSQPGTHVAAVDHGESHLHAEFVKANSSGSPASDTHLGETSDRAIAEQRTSDAKAVNTVTDAVAPSNDVYFIFDNVQDWQQIVASLDGSPRVHVMDSSRDGVEQIAAILTGEHDISAIHLISHGSEGSLNLGIAVLHSESMQGEYRDELTAIGQALSEQGDILIYGCDFAAGADGLEAAVILGGITKADIAASSDRTGSAARGGDWDLEQRTGTIEAAVLVDTSYEFLLAPPTIDLDGTLGSTGNSTANYTENGAAVPIVADGVAGATIVDVDDDLASISISVDAAPNGDAEHLSFSGTSVGLGSDSTNIVTVGATAYQIAYTAGTRTFVITNSAGGTIPSGGDTNTLVRSIAYDNASNDPTSGGTDADRVFSFTATDLTATTSAVSTATVAITAVNDAPVNTLPASGWTTNEDQAVQLTGIQVSDADAGGGGITVSLSVPAGTIDAASSGGVSVGGSATDRTLTGTVSDLNAYLASPSAPTYTPAADAVGDVTLTVTISDNGSSGGAAETDVDTATISITAVNDVPVGVDDTALVNEDATATGNLLTNDTDADGDALAVTEFTVDGATFTAGQTATLAAGTLVINADGSYTFTPLADYNGPVPAATYTLSDGTASSTAVLTINVIPVNDAPVDGNETNTVSEDNTLTVAEGAAGDLLDNATDVDGGALTISAFTVAGQGGPFVIGTGYAIAGVGTVTINANGSYSFTPAANFVGTIPLITYTVSDDAGGTDTSTLTLTMVAANDAPAGTNNTVTITEDTSYTFSAGSFGFSDPNDTPANAFQAVIITTLPPAGEGTLLLNGAAVTAGETIAVADIPNLVFQPVANLNGTAVGSFTFQVVDGGGTANSGQDTDQTPNTFAFNINAVNDPPVATDDTVTTPEDTTLSGNVLDNDTDVDGDALTITSFSALNVTAIPGQTGTIPGIGQITINADGSYTFVPVANFTGPVPTITYTISDGNGGTDTASLNIEVISVNDPPVDGNETNTVVEDTTLTVADGGSGDLLNNSSDLDGDPLTITSYTIPGVNGGNPIAAGTATLIPDVGTITINADGSYSFVPVADYDGPIPVITYTVSDGTDTDTSTLNLTMTPVNDAPIAVDDGPTTPENTPVAGNVLGNDTDVDDTTLTVTFFTINGQTFGAGTTVPISGVGTIVINSDGSYTCTPAPSYDGPVPPVTYTVSDGELTDTAVLQITIIPLNDPPVADDETGTTPEDTTLTVPASSGLLVGDTDVDGDPLIITEFEVAGTTYIAGQTATITGIGDLTINADGSYSFVPAPNYNGPVPVATYTVSDDSGATDQGTLTLNVTPVDDPPVAVDDTGTTPEDTPLGGNVLANDTDPDTDDSLTVVGFSVNGNSFIAGATATLPQGTITINADGTYTLVPAANYTGAVPVVTYVVVDENGATSTATLTLDVVPVNDPPVAIDDNGATAQDTTLNGNVIDNDSDVDGDDIVVTEYTIPGVNGGQAIPAGTATPIPGVGTITINPDGSYTFVPVPGYVGPVPPIEYTIDDGNGGTDQGALNIDVIPNTGGVGANDDVATTPEDITLTGNVVANDVGPNADPISVVNFSVAGDPTVYTPGQTAAIAGIGALTINLDGSYTFIPAANYFGPVPVVTYTAANGTVSDTATLTITVTPVNDLPVVVDDTGTTPEDTTLVGNVLSNDSDVEGVLTVTQFSVNGVTATAGQTGTIPGVGQITVNANGTYRFVPAENFNGPVPVVTYAVVDSNGATDTATLTITVTPVNDPPAAVNDTGTTPEDTTLTGNVLTNDTDVEGATLVVAGFEIGGTVYAAGQTATIAGIGALTINADGGYTFVPVLNYNGPVPVATYTVSDGAATATATFTITITPLNDAPVANDDTAILAEDTTLTVPAGSGLLVNDTDVDSTSLTVDGFAVGGIDFGAGTTATIPGVGQLTINADGSYTFTPVANFNGTVPPVTYRISDGNGGTDTAVLTITVTPVNDPPADGNETNTVVEDTTLTVADGASGDLLNNATDIDGINTLTIIDYSIPGINGGNAIAAGTTTLIPSVGTLTINANGSYTFAPAPDYTGPVPVITYTVSDNAGGTDTSSLVLTITPVNDPPIAVNDILTIPEDTTRTGNVLGNDVDVDGDTLTVTLYQVAGLGGFLPGAPAVIPGVGTLTVNADGSYTFVPVANYNGPVPVATYTIADASGIQDTADLIIIVTPVNDPPVDGDETNTVTEDTTLTVPAASGLLANASDIDGGPLSITGYTVAGITGTVGNPVAIAAVGTITINADGSYSFVSEPNYAGPIPSITYTISDGNGGTDTSTLTLTMVPVNDPPVDGDETNTVIEDTPLTVPTAGGLLVNASDIDGGALAITAYSIAGFTGTQPVGSAVAIPGVGTITINADGSYSFAPTANYTGPIPVITYTVSDGAGGTDTSTLTLTITPVNDPPVDGDETNMVIEDTTLTVADGGTGDLLNNATDVEGGTLTITGYTIAGLIGPRPVGVPVTIAGVGTITINANGSYSFVPVADYTGAIPVITYTVSDGNGGADTSTLTLTITPVNDAPAGTDNTVSINEDTAYTFAAVDFGFTDPNDTPANAMQAVIITTLPPAAEGTLLLSGVPVTAGQVITLAQIQSLTFQPTGDVNGNGIGAFTFQVIDDGGTANGGVNTDQSPNTFAFNIAPVNDPPVDGGETNTVIEDTTLAVPASGGLLVNASDVDGDTLTITGYTIAGVTGTQPVGSPVAITGVGTITINANGSYAFAPAANYTGAIPVITYTVSDGNGGTDTSTLTLTIIPVNDPPVDGDETNLVTEDTTLTVPAVSGLLANTTDVDGRPPSVRDFTIAGETGPFVLGSAYLIDGVGSVTVNADGSYSFTPTANYIGPIPVITYTVSDGAGGTDTSTLTLTMVPVNDPPVAVPDIGVTPEDTTLAGNVLDNDTDLDGGALRVTQFVVDGTTYVAGQTATIAGVGTLTINLNGGYTFVPAPNYNGPVPPATYTVSDGAGGTDSAILALSITPVNDPPVGTDIPNQVSIDANSVTPVDVSDHFSDGDGDVLTYSAIGLPPGLSIDPNTGLITGTLPNDASQQSPYTVIVTATDPAGVSATEIFRWIVINPPPIAVDDIASGPEDAVITGTVISNDSDPDGDAIFISQFAVAGGAYLPGQTATLDGFGTLVINGDGSYLFAPALNFNGVVPTVIYTLADDNGGTDTATLNITITPVNDPPVLVDDRASGNEDTTISGNVLDNDSDPDSDPLVVTDFSVDGDPTNYLPGDTATIGGVGTITLQADGSFVFVPAPNYDGPVPVIFYTASDGNGGEGQARLFITIQPVDDFVPRQDDNEPDLPDGPDFDYNPENVDGAVVEAVRGIDGLNDLADLSGEAVNAVAVNHFEPQMRFALTTFLGGSSSVVLERPGASDERIRIDAVKHSGVIYLQVLEEGDIGGQSDILGYRLHGQNGTPLPTWLRQLGPRSFAGNPEAEAETVDLILSVIQRDGQVVDFEIRLDSFSGHLSQPRGPEDHGFEPRTAPMFSEQMLAGTRGGDIGALERALGFR